jgi:type VI secretion system protein ImpA
LTGLCENFWADLYPALDGEEVDDRIAPLEWINQKLALGLKQIPLTLPRESGEESYSYADWEKACHLENQARKDPGMSEAALANLKPSVAAFRAGLISTDRSFYADLARELDGALNNCKQLQLLLDTRCGKSSPSLHQFNEVLRTIQQLVNESLGARETSVAPPEPQAPAPVDEEIEVWSSGSIHSRAEAYQRLAEAADYLLQTEPHSPTPYLVKRAVEWGDMDLFELLQQIVRNEGEMQEIDKLLRLSGKTVTDKD